MTKVPADTIKYNICGNIAIDGIVEKPDVVGAIFGQTEGLLGEDLELRELQKTGRIGRIEVDIKTKAGKSKGTVIVPSSLDMVETSIIAAAVETVDRVGPCNAKISVTDVEDARSLKRKDIVNRARQILNKLTDENIPQSQAIAEEVRRSVQLGEITSYKDLPAGPAVKDAESVIVVEGRADVLNLLKCGIKNAIGVEGTNIPPAISDISKKKTSIAFIDGDRGGNMILKELVQVADIDFVARAPYGKEVEDLGKKEVIMALRRKVPVNQVNGLQIKPSSNNSKSPDIKQELSTQLKSVKGKLRAKLFDKNLNLIDDVEVKDLIDKLGTVSPNCVVFDGIVTQRLIDVASTRGVKYVVGVNKSEISNTKQVTILTEKEL